MSQITVIVTQQFVTIIGICFLLILIFLKMTILHANNATDNGYSDTTICYNNWDLFSINPNIFEDDDIACK